MSQPTHLGRYRILQVLGRGGMGVVYEGHDPQIDRPVAIKTIALEALDAQEQITGRPEDERSDVFSAGVPTHAQSPTPRASETAATSLVKFPMAGRLHNSGGFRVEGPGTRPDDNFVTRDCTLRARLGGLEPQP